MPDAPSTPADLPIHGIAPQIISAMRDGNRLVLTAPTGSGKTTQVPQILHKTGQFPGEIIILQPRRLAARLVAARVASEMNCPLGQLVGYQTRHDSRISAATRIRFLTEGLLLRQLQSNRNLDGISCVILDEFHERNLASDTALALLKQLQEKNRPDLRLIVMSATLDTQLISTYLAAPTLEAHGRLFPVDIHHLQKRTPAPPWELAADALAGILDRREEGDILIFMPGVYEIRRTIDACQRHSTSAEPLAIFPLYSELPPDQQDQALAPSPHRRVIISTNVAETSITIPGIRHVIDSGLARINRFDPRRGINVLRIEPISRASADQRAGRAGRTAPGTCTRLWTAIDHRSRPAQQTPEVQRLDLAEVLLQLYALGISDPAAFPWLEPPTALALEQATKTLELLGAIHQGKLTALGREMSSIPAHPRLSRMLVEANHAGCLERASLWAALISERDILIRGAKHRFADDLPDGPRSDFQVLENAMDAARRARFDPGRCESLGINALAAREVDRTASLYLDAASRGAKPRHRTTDLASLARCLLVSFPDHLAIRRSESNLACAVVSNRRGTLDSASVAKHAGPLLAIEITEVAQPGRKSAAATIAATTQTTLSLVTEIDPAWLKNSLPDHLSTRRDTLFNPDTKAVESVEREMFDDLILAEKPLPEVDRSAAAEILADEVFKGNLKLDRWDESVDQWIARVRCVAEWFPDRKLITYSDDERRVLLSEICAGATRYSQIRDRPCLSAVKDALSWADQQFIEQMAPDRIQLPGGWRMRLDYTPGQPPHGRAKIQDLYGLNQSPTIAAGRVKVILEILAPNFRPIQVTDDLARFWKDLYPQVKKELSRRYPRHKWI